MLFQLKRPFLWKQVSRGVLHEQARKPGRGTRRDLDKATMSQNWFPGQGGGHYGQQQQQLHQPWGNQQYQGWVQGGQWVGQPHPQQTGFYGGQQQFQQFQSFGQPQQPALGGPQPLVAGGQFVAPRPRAQVPGPQAQFLTQQAYAQEHERRVREEMKKKELEEQKKKLQSLSVAKPSSAKQSINLNDLFEKQLPGPTQSRPPPAAVIPPTAPGTTAPATQPQSVQKEQKQSAKARSWASEDFSGLFAQHQTPPATQDDGGESDNFGDFQSSGQQLGGFPAFPVASHQPQGLNHIQQSLPGDQPGGHMMQPGDHMMQPGSHMMQPGGHIMQPGDHMMQPGGHMMQPVGHMMQSGGHMMQPGGHMMQPGGHMMQPGGHTMQPGNHMMQPGNHTMQPVGHVIQGGSHMISTSAYQEPLSSTNVQQGVQGSQPPGSPQRQHSTTSSQFSYSTAQSSMAPPQPFNTYTFPQTSTPGDPGNIAPQQQGLNTGPLNTGNSGPPVSIGSPGSGGVDTSPFHPLYHKVYRLCHRPGEELVSTELLYPVLLSSKLPRAQLRDLWARANKGKPGQLSQMELFVLLGLVGLAQAGNQDPSLEDLKKAPSIPVPTLPGLSVLSPTSSLQSGAPALSPSSLQPAAPENDFGQFHTQQPPILQPSPGLPELSGTPELGPSFSLPPPLTAAKFPPPSPTPTVPVSGPPPPSPHVPPGNQSDKQRQVEDDFGDFAQFSAPETTSSLFPSTTAPSLSSPLPPPPLPLPPGDDRKHPPPSEFGGWADFGQFSSALPTTNTGVQQSPFPTNEQELLNNQTSESPLPDKTKESSSAKSRMFEFQSSSSQTPTIDGMEKDLLSKLTPTLPRKSQAEATEKKKEEKTEKPVKSGLPKVEKKGVGEEEGWRLCLAKAGEVLASCVEILADVEDQEILQEIATAKEAHSRLQGIAEVYRFAKRIFATLSAKYPKTAVSAGQEVKKVWSELKSLLPDNAMEEIYQSTCPSAPSSETDVLSDTISHCSICLMSKTVSISSPVSLDSTPEEYGLGLIFYQGQTYHASCANFWRHLVAEEVPVLG